MAALLSSIYKTSEDLIKKNKEKWLSRQVRFFFTPLTKVLTRATTDAYVISYPKAGRTWLRVLLCHLYQDRARLQDLDLNITQRGHKWKLPNVRFTHAGGTSSRRRPFTYYKKRYQSKNVVFLARGVGDTLVSSYFHTTKRRQQFTGDISSFIHDERYGAAKIVTYMNNWVREQKEMKDFLLVRYEDMRRDTVSEFNRITKFLGIEASDEEIQRAVQQSSFEKMKEMERTNATNDRRLQPIDPNDPQSFQVRRGVVGGYLEILSPKDIEYINHLITTELDPIFGYKVD